MIFNHKGELRGSYCFAAHQGAKASFYYQKALEDMYSTLWKLLPGLSKEDWIEKTELGPGRDTWIEYAPHEKRKLHPSHDFELAGLHGLDDSKKVENIYCYGADRAKSMGLYSYLVD